MMRERKRNQMLTNGQRQVAVEQCEEREGKLTMRGQGMRGKEKERLRGNLESSRYFLHAKVRFSPLDGGDGGTRKLLEA